MTGVQTCALPIFDDDVRAATAMLEAHRGQHPGTMVERKPFSVAIHYPHAEPTREAHFRAGVRALAERVPRLEVLAGKHVLEFRPRSGWTKGDIVRLLLRAHADGAVGIAMGDDVTDEDAFRALGPQGYSVLVGPEPAWRTSARYGLATPAEVRVWIETLTSVRSGRSVLPARPD